MTRPPTFRERYEASLPPFQCDGFNREPHIVDSIIACDGRDLCAPCYTAWKDARAVDDELALLEVMNDARGG